MSLIRWIFDNQYRKKLSLIQQINSKDNAIAVQAIDTLRKLREDAYSNKNEFSGIRAGGWTNLSSNNFTGANLQGANLSGVGFNLSKSIFRNAILCRANLNDTILDEAILDNADLSDALMQEVHMIGSSLRHAILCRANLEVAHLHGADFSFADFREANLVDARMSEANFYNADFRNADLHFAGFKNANLENANLENANFEGAIWGREHPRSDRRYKGTLPDGSKFTNKEDLKRFTNRDHPNFWRPSIPVAWGGKDGISKRDNFSSLDLRLNDKY